MVSAGVSTSTSSNVSLSGHEIAQLQRPLAAWDSSPTGSAGSATDFSGTETTFYSFRYILMDFDTGASFHMTYDSSTLTSVRPVFLLLMVLPSPSSRGTL